MANNISWQMDPITGDYVLDSTGSPTVSNDLKTPAYFRLAINRTRWMYAPDAKYGSDFYLLRRKHAGNDGTKAQSIAERALQPMIDDGRASGISVTLTSQTRGTASLAVVIEDNQGRQSTVPLDRIGV